MKILASVLFLTFFVVELQAACSTITGPRNIYNGCDNGWIPITNSVHCPPSTPSYVDLCLQPCTGKCKVKPVVTSLAGCTSTHYKCVDPDACEPDDLLPCDLPLD